MNLEELIKEKLNKTQKLILGQAFKGKSLNERYKQIDLELNEIYKNREKTLFLDKNKLEILENQIIKIKQKTSTYLGSRMKYDYDLETKVNTVIEKLQLIRNEHYSIGNYHKANINYFNEINKIVKGKLKKTRTYADRFNTLENKLKKYDKNRANIEDLDEFRNILASFENNKYLQNKIKFIEQLEKKNELEEYKKSLSKLKRKYFEKDLEMLKKKKLVEKQIEQFEDSIQKMIKPRIVNLELKEKPDLNKSLEEYRRIKNNSYVEITNQTTINNISYEEIENIKEKTMKNDKDVLPWESENFNETKIINEAIKHYEYKRPSYLDTKFEFATDKTQRKKENYLSKIRIQISNIYKNLIKPAIANIL